MNADELCQWCGSPVWGSKTNDKIITWTCGSFKRRDMGFAVQDDSCVHCANQQRIAKLESALKKIAIEFIDHPGGVTRIYSDVKSVLDRIRKTAEDAIK